MWGGGLICTWDYIRNFTVETLHKKLYDLFIDTFFMFSHSLAYDYLNIFFSEIDIRMDGMQMLILMSI